MNTYNDNSNHFGEQITNKLSLVEKPKNALKYSDYNANQDGFTFAPSKPMFKRTVTRFEQLKRIKLISVFKFVFVAVLVVTFIDIALTNNFITL